MKVTRHPSSTNILAVSGWDIYTLPGTVACVPCGPPPTTTAITTGAKSELPAKETDEPMFYPNPANDQVKLKYELPKDCKTASIKIQDVQGKLIAEFKVDDTFDFIYLPSAYNSGLYFYSLVIDGKVIKTKKIIINK